MCDFQFNAINNWIPDTPLKTTFLHSTDTQFHRYLVSATNRKRGNISAPFSSSRFIVIRCQCVKGLGEGCVGCEPRLEKREEAANVGWYVQLVSVSMADCINMQIVAARDASLDIYQWLWLTSWKRVPWLWLFYCNRAMPPSCSPSFTLPATTPLPPPLTTASRPSKSRLFFFLFRPNRCAHHSENLAPTDLGPPDMSLGNARARDGIMSRN